MVSKVVGYDLHSLDVVFIQKTESGQGMNEEEEEDRKKVMVVKEFRLCTPQIPGTHAKDKT